MSKLEIIGYTNSGKPVWAISGGATGDPQLVHEDRLLSQISVGYQNNAFVGDVLFPAVRVTKQSDRYLVLDRRENFKIHEARRDPGARANEIPPLRFSEDAYFATERALKGVVPWEERENADPEIFNELMDESERVTDSILLEREFRIADYATTVANYAPGHAITLSGTDQWDDHTNSDPKGDVKPLRDLIFLNGLFKQPNVAIAGWKVMSGLEDHPDFIERIKYSERGVTTDDLVSQVFGLPRIVRAAAAQDVSNPAAAAADLELLWGNSLVLAYVPERPGRRTVSYGYEFVWPFNGGQIMPTERWQDIERKSDIVRVSRRYDLKPIAVDENGLQLAGALIKNAVSA